MPPPVISREPWKDGSAKPYIHVQGVSKMFGSNIAVEDVTLSVYRGELFSLLGGSGCGKTTLLRMLAGFEAPTEGRIYIDGVDVTPTPPYERPVNMMFQSYALFPHMTVSQNIAFGLHQEGLPRPEIDMRVAEVLELVRLNAYANRKPSQLSGGQKQRVALARCLAKRPKVLLLDEPLGALDKTLRENTQFELMNIQENLGITTILVTHDQEEAMTMSSRIAIMDHGRIRQVGTPGEIYEYPNSLEVAKFIGSINIFEGFIEQEASDHVIVQANKLTYPLKVGHAASAPVGAQVHVAVRPEKVKISFEMPQTTCNMAQGLVKDIAYLGDVSIYHVQLSSGQVILTTQPNLARLAERAVSWDDQVWLWWQAESSIVLTT